MLVYKQWMFVLGLACSTYAIFESAYWTLGIVGITLMLFGPFAEYPIGRRDYHLSFVQVWELLHQGGCISYDKTRVFFERGTLDRIKELIKRNEQI